MRRLPVLRSGGVQIAGDSFGIGENRGSATVCPDTLLDT